MKRSTFPDTTDRKSLLPFGIIVGVVGNLWTLYLASFLLMLPRGGDYRPMAYAVYVGLTAIATLAIGMPLSCCALKWSKGSGIIGILLALLPWPLGIFLMNLIAKMNGWTIAD